MGRANEMIFNAGTLSISFACRVAFCVQDEIDEKINLSVIPAVNGLYKRERAQK